MFGRTRELRCRGWVASFVIGALAATPHTFAIAADEKVETVEALIRVHATQPALLKEEKFDIIEFEVYKRTQGLLVLSRPVLDAALQDFGAGKSPLLKGEHDQVAWLLDNLRVEVPKDSEILRLTLSGDDHAETAKLVDAVVDAYFKVVVTGELNDHRRRREDLERRRESYLDDLRARTSDIQALSSALGTSDSDKGRLKTELLAKDAAFWHEQSRKLEAKLARDEAILAQMDKDSAELKSLSKQIAATHAEKDAIDKRREVADAILMQSVRTSADLEVKKTELSSMSAVARQITDELERANIEVNAPARVSLVQHAAP